MPAGETKFNQSAVHTCTCIECAALNDHDGKINCDICRSDCWVCNGSFGTAISPALKGFHTPGTS